MTKKISIVIIVLCFVVLWSTFSGGDKPASDSPVSQPGTSDRFSLPHEAIIYAGRNAVRHCLKPAGSVKFPAWPDDSYGIVYLEDETYLVTGEVTAKNAFGVDVLDTWSAQITFSGRDLETVRAIHIKVGDEVLIDAP
ncbi:MAG: hypothetical protein FVQ79_08705 [Planctomycetes bacterium]|nr:hypothetical protein [Planctomycetota bacterium]